MITIDYTDKRPIYEQIIERVQSLVLCGVFEKDAILPSVRNLAIELSINPNTIQRAYSELERRGVIYTVKGKGNFVADSQALEKIKRNEYEQDEKKLVEKAKSNGIRLEKFLEELRNIWSQNEDPERISGKEKKEAGGERK